MVPTGRNWDEFVDANEQLQDLAELPTITQLDIVAIDYSDVGECPRKSVNA